ncbi:hypothetical protein KQX54_015253 [Cotesia glomerata]|uniref:Carboxypeptidase n=1 Tax=Cotesia glomerata TaxID=32391 RepID=A0AAV7HYV2_COTGL|nr:hypothetical protein KQX54_015253 [Cotesia glomerata]
MIWIVLVILLTPSSLYATNSDEVGKKGFGPGKQDWGYVLVRPAAHMFWWLYYVNPPVMNSSINLDVYSIPLIIWLQGGPGVSATGFGNFNELGPLDIDLKPRNHMWVNDYNILFIDNPVGTGFSFVDNDTAMAENNTQIAQDLVECMKSFLESVPKFKNVPTYIVAESYGGKIVVEFALIWFRAQNTTYITCKLKGIAVGDSPISFAKVVRSIPTYLLNMVNKFDIMNPESIF